VDESRTKKDGCSDGLPQLRAMHRVINIEFRPKSCQMCISNILAMGLHSQNADFAGTRLRSKHDRMRVPWKPRVSQKRLMSGWGNLYITVTGMGSEKCSRMSAEPAGVRCRRKRPVSWSLLALRSGVAPEATAELLCLSTVAAKKGKGDVEVLSCPDPIGRMIEESLNGQLDEPGESFLPDRCLDCGSTLEHEGGCVICRSCGFSRCF